MKLCFRPKTIYESAKIIVPFKEFFLVQYGGAKEGNEVYYKTWYRKRRGEIDSKRVVILGGLV